MNSIQIIGTLTDAFVLNHEVENERFFHTYILNERLSGTNDVLPIIASEYIARLDEFEKGQKVCVNGEIRTYNDDQKRLHVFVFVNSIEPTDEPDLNKVTLEGYLCRKPNLRETPFGREISDVLLAVGRRYGKTDYIPCIIWGRNARKAFMFDIGTRVCITGRFQCRPYLKKTDDGVEERIAYEVSAENIKEV